MASSSPPPVHTCCPFFATTVAVPVSWQNGKTPLAAISALRNMVMATYLSFSLASGSVKIFATIFKCSVRSMKEQS